MAPEFRRCSGDTEVHDVLHRGKGRPQTPDPDHPERGAGAPGRRGAVVCRHQDHGIERPRPGPCQCGKTRPTTLTVASADPAFITELLYNRRYSLLWEQGTRWIDARRFGLLNTIPPQVSGGSVPVAMPVPNAECSARGLDTDCT